MKVYFESNSTQPLKPTEIHSSEIYFIVVMAVLSGLFLFKYLTCAFQAIYSLRGIYD